MPNERYDGSANPLVDEAKSRLEQLGRTQRRVTHWPRGCYGSDQAWLVFVGPSPGGTEKPIQGNRPWDETPLYNEIFDEFHDWNGGFPIAMKPLVEGITGLPFEQAGRLYAFANLDWLKTPCAANVSMERMERGLPDVWWVLEHTRPGVVVPLTKQVAHLLTDFLATELKMRLDFRRYPMTIPIGISGLRSHRYVEAWRVEVLRRGDPWKLRIVRLPQHPARILSDKYAERLASGVLQAAVMLDS